MDSDGKGEAVNDTLEEHSKRLGVLAADFAMVLYKFNRKSNNSGDRVKNFRQELLEHSRTLREMAKKVEQEASKLREKKETDIAKNDGKHKRSNVPDHFVSDEPCDKESKDDLDKILKSQPETVTEFWKNKYEEDAGRNWDLFYKRNESRFFKDRHYLRHIIGDDIKKLLARRDKKENNTKTTLFEVGCGVGNAMFPLLKEYPQLHVLGVDISKRAIELIQQRKDYKSESHRCKVWVCNLVEDPLPVEVSNIDIGTFIFVLSAIHPGKISSVLKKVYDCLIPGGMLMIRDYAIYDLSQLRFGTGSKLGENFYVRQDGTRTYFFSKKSLGGMLSSAGFVVDKIEYHRKLIRNAKKGIEMKRTWIQATAYRAQK